MEIWNGGEVVICLLVVGGGGVSFRTHAAMKVLKPWREKQLERCQNQEGKYLFI